MKNSIQILAGFIISTAVVTAVNAQKKDFKTDAATGVQYRFIKHDKNGTKPAENDIARIVMVWSGKTMKGDADSIYLDTHKRGGDSIGAISIPLKKTFKGSLEEGVLMMATGDSAAFHINGDSLYMKTFHQPAEKVPHYVTPTTEFTFYVKLIGFKTKAELEAGKQLEAKKRMEQTEALKTEENANIAAYLKKNNLNVKPDDDSIFYLQETKGTGPKVKEGDSLIVKYVGMNLDGNVFDKSEGRGNGTFPVVYAKNMPLIQGWIHVLGKMNEGDKVRVLIPSKLAYGARGAGGIIKPYAPLIFDMELVRVVSPK